MEEDTNKRFTLTDIREQILYTRDSLGEKALSLIERNEERGESKEELVADILKLLNADGNEESRRKRNATDYNIWLHKEKQA